MRHPRLRLGFEDVRGVHDRDAAFGFTVADCRADPTARSTPSVKHSGIGAKPPRTTERRGCAWVVLPVDRVMRTTSMRLTSTDSGCGDSSNVSQQSSTQPGSVGYHEISTPGVQSGDTQRLSQVIAG